MVFNAGNHRRLGRRTHPNPCGARPSRARRRDCRLATGGGQRPCKRPSTICCITTRPAAWAAAPSLPALAQPTVLKAYTLNHASLIVSNVERSLKFYQSTFGMTVKSTGTGGANLALGDQFL